MSTREGVGWIVLLVAVAAWALADVESFDGRDLLALLVAGLVAWRVLS